MRQGKKDLPGARSSTLRFVRGRVTRYCVSVRPNHSSFTSWLCRQGQRYPGAVDDGATAGAGSDCELGPQAMSRKAGYAGRGQRSGSFQGLSRRSGPGAWASKEDLSIQSYILPRCSRSSSPFMFLFKWRLLHKSFCICQLSAHVHKDSAICACAILCR